MRTRWKLQNLGRWAGLLALSVLVTVLVFLGGIVLLAWQTGEGQASSLAGRVPSPDAGGGRELYAPKLRSASGRRRVDAALRCRWKRRLAVEQA